MKIHIRMIAAFLILLLSIIVVCKPAVAENRAESVALSRNDVLEKPAEANAVNLQKNTIDIKNSNKESATEAELKILKEKNTLIADFQASMISIVVWALGAVVSVVVLLVGASLFTNFKLHEKDIQRIQFDYDAKIRVFKSEMEAILAKSNQDAAAAQEIRSQQDLNRMLDQTSQVRSHFETVRVSLEDKFDGLQKSTANFDGTVKFLEKRQDDLTTELRRIETGIWELKEIPSNILIASLQGLDSAIKSDNKYDIDDFIRRIKETLEEEFVSKKNILSAMTLGSFDSRLKKLSKIRPNDERDIRDLIFKCKRESSDDVTSKK